MNHLRSRRSQPIAEKLALLDTLRERELAIRQPDHPEMESTGALHEAPASYRAGGKKTS